MPVSGRRRPWRHPLAPVVLVVAATIWLPGRFFDEPVLLDSLALRVKERVLSPLENFDPASSQVVSPYFRPLFTLLHGVADRLPIGPERGERLLALACHAFAALALWRLARALKLRRDVALGGLVVFLLAPPNTTTAAWPVVGYWPLAAAFSWLAIADFVEFTATGRRARAVRGALLFAIGLLSAETGYHFVALLPLLALAPPRAGSRRIRPLVLWPIVALVAFAHFHFGERASSGLVTTAPLDRLRTAFEAWWRYLESGLGGDAFSGARPIAWAAFACILLGAWSFRGPRRRFLVLHALIAPFPFAALGHNDRCGYFAYGVAALAFAACAPRGIARVLLLLRLTGIKGIGGGMAVRRVRRAFMGSLAPIVLLLLAFVDQRDERARSMQLACDETAALRSDLAPLAPSLLAADLDAVAFVNCPSTLRFAVYDALSSPRAEDLKPLRTTAVLCTKRGYFSAGPIEFASAGCKQVVVCEGGRLVARPPDRPLGAREPLPFVFLAGGVDVVAPPREGFESELARQRYFDGLLTRTRELEDPLNHVLIEQELPELREPLPDEAPEWRLEPVPTPAGTEPPPGLFGQRLVVRVDVPSAALLVVITYLAADDPLRRVTGDFGRHSELLQARLDGVPIEIVPVFVHACGILVPAGAHEIVLQAKPLGGKGFSDVSPR